MFKNGLILLSLIILGGCSETDTKSRTDTVEINESSQRKVGTPRIVIHGGAGNIVRENMSAEMIAKYQEKLKEALDIGYAILDNGVSSADAVIQAIQCLEESPLFNAGVGAVLTNKGTVSHDASFMNGETKEAGAIAGSSIIKSPIMAAYLVQEKSKHVFLAGEGAHEFALFNEMETVSPSYFITDRRKDQLSKVKNKNASIDPFMNGHKTGTVGAVALDINGNICAGTSTGGMTNKRFGRIGDSPIIGAGTYADNQTCGVSATGHGEFFIRHVVAYDIAARMKYNNQSAIAASNEVIQELENINGYGGVIVLDQSGVINMPFNTAGMFRGYKTDTSGAVVKLFQK